jgi:hypothetical protein
MSPCSATVSANLTRLVRRRLPLCPPLSSQVNPSFHLAADFYKRSYDAVRAAEYTLEGALPVMVVIHDAFQQISNWGACHAMCLPPSPLVT